MEHDEAAVRSACAEAESCEPAVSPREWRRESSGLIGLILWPLGLIAQFRCCPRRAIVCMYVCMCYTRFQLCCQVIGNRYAASQMSQEESSICSSGSDVCAALKDYHAVVQATSSEAS